MPDPPRPARSPGCWVVTGPGSTSTRPSASVQVGRPSRGDRGSGSPCRRTVRAGGGSCYSCWTTRDTTRSSGTPCTDSCATTTSSAGCGTTSIRVGPPSSAALGPYPRSRLVVLSGGRDGGGPTGLRTGLRLDVVVGGLLLPSVPVGPQEGPAVAVRRGESHPGKGRAQSRGPQPLPHPTHSPRRPGSDWVRPPSSGPTRWRPSPTRLGSRGPGATAHTMGTEGRGIVAAVGVTEQGWTPQGSRGSLRGVEG